MTDGPLIQDEPIRITVFPDRDECILFFAPKSGVLSLPRELTAPFSKGEVASAFKTAGIDVRVSETSPGRWTNAMTKARRDAKAERGQRQMLKAAESAIAERKIPGLRARSDVILRKQEVDRLLAAKKSELADAKKRYTAGGRGLTTKEWRKLSGRIDDLKQESQSLQAQMGVFKAKEKAENKVRQQSQDRNFIQAAKEMLEPELFQDLWDTAIEITADQDEAAEENL